MPTTDLPDQNDVMHALPAIEAPTVLAIVQAGGKGSRLDVLTRERAKPALPVAGEFQLIDVAMSNLMHSGVLDVWVSVQYLASSLDEHLLAGKPWDLDRRDGGFRRMVPQEGGGSAIGEGFAGGSADDLFGCLPQIEAEDPDVVVAMSADQLMRVDLRRHVATHVARGADATVLTVEVPPTEARHKAVVQVDAGQRVTSIVDKPDRVGGGTISAEVVLFDRSALVRAIEQVRRERGHGDEPTLGDLAEHLLPWMVEHGHVAADPLPGYWKDLGRPQNYLLAHRDILRGECDLFDDPAWRIITNPAEAPAARLRAGSVVSDSLVSRGCDIAGEVRRSVLGPGVRVESGAVVEDAVVFGGVHIGAGARIATAVIDEGTTVGRGARIGTLHPGRLSDEVIALVGRDSRIAGGSVVDAGARLEPGTTT